MEENIVKQFEVLRKSVILQTEQSFRELHTIAKLWKKAKKFAQNIRLRCWL